MKHDMTPEVICHIMGSVDGRLLPPRWTPPFDGSPAGNLFAEYAAAGKELETDAWMFGKTTTAEMFPGKFISSVDVHPQAGRIHIAPRESARLFITVDPEADILFSTSLLRGDNILTILGTNAGVDYLEYLESKEISYIVMEDVADLRGAMRIVVEKFGVKRISLQGGGIIDGAMLAAGLLSELSLVVYPGIDGHTSAPSIFEYIGDSDKPAFGQSLELKSVSARKHGIVWLRYLFHKK